MHHRINFKRVRSRTSRAAIRTLNDDSIQQPGTFVQQAHYTSSVKGKSWSASKIHFSSDVDSLLTITTNTKRKKVNKLRSSNKEDTCSFKLKVVCYKTNDKWYIKSQTDNCNGVKVGVHYGHLQIKSDHITNKVDHLNSAVYNLIENWLKEQQSPARMSTLVFVQYSIVLLDSGIRQYKTKLVYLLLITKQLDSLMVLLLIVSLQIFQIKMTLVVYMLLTTYNLDL